MSMFRRGVIAGLVGVAAAIFAAAPTSAQTSNSYSNAHTTLPAFAAAAPAGVATSAGVAGAAGVVLGSAGQRDATPAPAVTGQVLSLQVSPAAPVATGGQASVSGIAFTGADVITLLFFAVPLIVLGLTLTRQARPRQASDG